MIENLPIIIKEVNRLNIGPNETLVVHLPDNCAGMSDEELDWIRGRFSECGIKRVILVTSDTRFTVIKEQQK